MYCCLMYPDVAFFLSFSLSHAQRRYTVSLAHIYSHTGGRAVLWLLFSTSSVRSLSLSLSHAQRRYAVSLSLSHIHPYERSSSASAATSVSRFIPPPLAHACASTLFLEFACPLGCRPRGRRTAFTRRCIRGCCECSYVRVSVWVGVVSSVIIAVGLARWRAPGAEYGCRAYMGALTPGAQYHLPCASSARARACHSAFCFAYRSHSLSLSAVVIVAGMGNFPGVCACVVGSSIPRQNNKTKRKQRINYVQAIARS